MGEPVRRNMRIHSSSFQGNGCLAGCMLHLAALLMLGAGVLAWLIKYRAWELTVTVELPTPSVAAPAAAPPSP